MSQRICCVKDCVVTAKQGIPLHSFPNPDSQADLFQLWVSNIGNNLSTLESQFVYKNRKVCQHHFEKIFLFAKNKINRRVAVPRLHIPGYKITDAMPEGSMATTSSDIHALPTLSVVSSCTTKKSLNTSLFKSKNIKYHNLTEKEKELCAIVNKTKKQLKIYQKSKDRFKKQVAVMRKFKKSDAFELLSKNLTNSAKTFIAMQISQSAKKHQGRRFTLDEKILALSIYKPSPRAYRVLSQVCILPKKKTLNKLLSSIQMETGINDNMFQNLKKKVERMPENYKFATLVFDEMAISPTLALNTQDDMIKGFVDDGETRDKEFGNHALVFMVRGVVKKYKQPVSYTICAGTTKTIILKKLIKQIITKLQDVGFKIVATVCDQGATNVAAINSLIKDTKEVYLKKNKLWKNEFFKINGKKIYPIFDPPHLIKGIRNNLLTKDLNYFNKDGKKCTAKWTFIVDLYKRDPGYKGVKLMPKLTANHVIDKCIPKMKVKFCTQVFSRTVGVTMGFMADSGKLPEASKETADIILLFDSLFDSVNGSSNKVKGGKIYRTAVTHRSPHLTLWHNSIKTLKSMKFIDINGKTCNVPSLSSWIRTLYSFEAIIKIFFKLGITSLLLRHFNQDPLENFFGAIRAHGQSYNMPNAVSFENAYKTLLINNLTSHHSVGANCEKDHNICLQSLKYLLADSTFKNKQASENQTIDFQHLNMTVIDTQSLVESDNNNNKERCAAIAYCSGWLLKKVKKIFQHCQTCKSDLECPKPENFHDYIEAKNYSDKRWLCYPTRKLFDMFAHIEDISLQILKEKCEIKGITEYIKTAISVNIDFNFISCSEHRHTLIKTFIDYTVNFCVRNWIKDVNNILIGKATNCDVSDPVKEKASSYHLKHKSRMTKK